MRRAGFTLVEMLIVVAVLAVLATFVVPELLDRIDDAEPVRMAEDIRSVGSAIEVFQLDTRNAFPGDLEDLVYRVVPGTDVRVDGGAYTDRHQSRWNGPYLKGTLPEGGAAGLQDPAMQTGFDAQMMSRLVLWNQRASNADNQLAEAAAKCTEGSFVTVRVLGLTEDEFAQVNELIDGDDETAPTTQGNLRWAAGAEGAESMTYYLAVSCR